jgi:replicative DNA helicase
MLEEGHGGADGGVRTGFHDLDRIIKGLRPGELAVLAGRPAMGKTTLALNIARNVAIDQGKTVAIFCLEMTEAEVLARLFSAEARVEVWRLRRGLLRKEQEDRVRAASSLLEAAPLRIEHGSPLDLKELSVRSRQMKAEDKQLGLVVVDYFELLLGDATGEFRDEQISRGWDSLKTLARELSLPVLVVSQLSFAETERDDWRPRLSDIEDTGADLAILLYRHEVYQRDTTDKAIAEVSVATRERGLIGGYKLTFDEDFMRFRDL